MKNFEIPYYHDYISPVLAKKLLAESKDVPGVEGLTELGSCSGLENPQSLTFLKELYLSIKDDLAQVLRQRQVDRKFIDDRVKAGATILGLRDSQDRVVIGPLNNNYAKAGGAPIAEIPKYLKGPHVTLFGPPDSAKMAINAMNCFHRKLFEEPALVGELLAKYSSVPKWGADDEDSKTPLRRDLVEAAVNLTACFNGTLSFKDKKKYELAKTHRAVPIKRFPGLALPATFLFCHANPIPLHLYDFAIHLFENWHNPEALCFYVPKLENEEEAKYIYKMVFAAEKKIKALHPEYVLGSVRLMVVLENPRAILRAHEIMDALHPYFVGASLGWHDYLGSTARIFKEDPQYRIPVKADPNIVIKYIKASHRLLADVVGSRSGIKVGGMYGILPLENNLQSDSFQMTILGFIKDVITQMKRDLTGYWVAHPDFVRLGIALVEAWKLHARGDKKTLDELVKSLLVDKHHQDILEFIHGPDIEGLDINDPNYVESLIVADIKESDFIANNHPDEIRYNVFQSLQYFTDWLTGNGCVALPAIVNNTPVRVMDDLATAERSRWEVWAEIYHGRFLLEDFIKISHEEMHFIRKDLSDDKKIVQVKYTKQTAHLYPIALRLMLKLMTDSQPVEFATELLIPFTIDKVRQAKDPWAVINELDPGKFDLEPRVERLHRYFEACGCDRFAVEMSKNSVMDLEAAENIIGSFSLAEILQAASFHGDIGEDKKNLDAQAAGEQAKVFLEADEVLNELQTLGQKYKDKFGFKFLVSAQGKSGIELLSMLKNRIERTAEEELNSAREALWHITKKRLEANPLDDFIRKLKATKFNVAKLSKPKLNIAINESGETQEVFVNVSPETDFEAASLSKTLAACFAIDYFASKNISLQTPVNDISPDFQLEGDWGEQVTLEHLMSHRALDKHYVTGYPSNKAVPPIKELLNVKVINEPGRVFSYSGGGFLVLQHLIEELEKNSIHEITKGFFKKLGLKRLNFNQDRPGDRLDFPAFAAGALGTAGDMAQFLGQLTNAYNEIEGAPGIAHDTAVQMLYGQDFGSMEFIGARCGLGTFIAEAGDNKICLHQGANDGYRALYLQCFYGPDRGKGFVIFSEGDNEAVPLIASAAQNLLRHLNFSGINFEKFKTSFNDANIKQEQIVNLTYKEMIFSAFEPCLPPKIIGRREKDPLASVNLACGAKISNVTNQKFARAENLINPYRPVFDPLAFCTQGKVMDSWETERHNPNEFHSLDLELADKKHIKYISVSTEYHDGNHVEAISIDGLLPKTQLNGHSEIKIQLEKAVLCKNLKLKAYPDGGLTRLGLFTEVPCPDEFNGQSKRFSHAIPTAAKPLSLPYTVTNQKVIKVSNEHYGPAEQVLSPYPPLHMFDGYESARSRSRGHIEELQIQLMPAQEVKNILFDFSYFINNCPEAVSIHGKTADDWIELQAKTSVKSYAGNKRLFEFDQPAVFSELMVRVYPDGGINRIRINHI